MRPTSPKLLNYEDDRLRFLPELLMSAAQLPKPIMLPFCQGASSSIFDGVPVLGGTRSFRAWGAPA
jgi:hypothetical protein